VSGWGRIRMANGRRRIRREDCPRKRFVRGVAEDVEEIDR